MAYSPRGDQLAVTAACDADPPACGDLLVATGGQVRSVSPAGVSVDSNALWSADERELFVVLTDPVGSPDSTPKHPRLVAVDVTTAHPRLIAPLPNWGTWLDAVSRDGSLVAIRTFSPARMWIVPTAGGDLQRIPWPPTPGFVDGSAAVFLR